MDILGGFDIRYAASCVRAVTLCQMEFAHPLTIINRYCFGVNRSEAMLPPAVFYSCLKEKGGKTNQNIF